MNEFQYTYAESQIIARDARLKSISSKGNDKGKQGTSEPEWKGHSSDISSPCGRSELTKKAMLKECAGDSRLQEPISDLDHVLERHGNPDTAPGLTSTV